MTLIVTEQVYRLLATEKVTFPHSRMFLCQIYHEPAGGEPSWAVQHDMANEKSGIKLECEDVTLWCSEEDKASLDNQILLQDTTRGLITVPVFRFDD